MEPDLTKDAPEEASGEPLSGAYASDAMRPGSGGRTSSLNLPGGAPRPGTQPLPAQPGAAAPEISLKDGVARARNITKALGMIVLLLLRYFFVKVLGHRVQAAHSRAMIQLGRWIYALAIVLEPHLARARAQLAKTTNILKRGVLIALIIVLAPLEKGASLAAKQAKLHGTRLAAQGARTTVQVLAPVFAAVGQALRAGFQKAAVQRALGRLIQILEEAQR